MTIGTTTNANMSVTVNTNLHMHVDIPVTPIINKQINAKLHVDTSMDT